MWAIGRGYAGRFAAGELEGQLIRSVSELSREDF